MECNQRSNAIPVNPNTMTGNTDYRLTFFLA